MKAINLQPLCSLLIPLSCLYLIVLTTINFNYQLFIEANEINDIISNRVLSAEFDSAKLRITQSRPEHFLGFSLFAPKFSC